MLLLAVPLAGCIGVAPSAGPGISDGSAAPPARTAADNATRRDTNFSWHVSGGPTYFVFAYRAETDGKYEMGFDVNATWTDRRAYLFISQGYHGPLEGHIAHPAGFYIAHRDSCTDDTEGTPSQPEQCERRNWTESGRVGRGGNLATGVYMQFVAAYGADRATLNVSLDTSEPVEILWTDQGSTRLVELLDHDVERTYPQGAVRFNANASLSADSSYFAHLELAGVSRIRPDYRISGPDTHRFLRQPEVCVDPIHTCRPGGYYYSRGPRTSTPQKVGFAQYSAQAGNWTAQARGGLRSQSSAGLPVWGIIEDPRFVDDEGRLTGPE